MLRSSALVLFALTLSSCVVAPTGGGTPQPVLEIVVYRVKDSGAAEPLRQAAHAHISGYPGFVRALRLGSVDDPALFADVVEWRSPAQAHAATARAAKDPAVQPLFGTIGPIISMGHYPLATGASGTLLTQLAEAPIVEIAIYTVSNVELQAAAQPGLHRTLRSMPVVLGSAPLKAVEGAGYVDLIGWQGKEAHADVAARMKGDPHGAAFIANIGKMEVCALFKVVGSATAR
jgi:hypothetical protein